MIMLNIEKLKWDSDFFNLDIGKLDLAKESQTNDISKLIALKPEFDLIYIYSKSDLKNEISQFEDCKVVLSYSIGSRITDNDCVCSCDEWMYDSLLSLALQSGEYSRFKLDPKFEPKAFSRLYEEWLKSSLDRVIADEVLSFNDSEGLPIGFVTLGKKGDYCEIGLLAVNESSRGQGIGKKLIYQAINYTLAQGYKELRVPTQKRNIKALEFYKRMNFKVIDETYIYHYWL
jgi:dTDP-4-amino-4,6-dideoxy-D-galactose acyltransferase